MDIAVVMGGPSVEHEISLQTGREVLQHASREQHRYHAVIITHDRRVYTKEATRDAPSLEACNNPGEFNFNGPFSFIGSDSVWHRYDMALLALHGAFGEDGCFQGFLYSIGLPYTGSGVFASAVAMNKIAAKDMFERHGLHTPPSSVFGRHNPNLTIDAIRARHGFPCYVKCPQSGSSRLMGRADTADELTMLIEKFTPCASSLLVESAVEGLEFSCGVISGKDITVEALPPIEIRPVQAAFFDYEAKYTSGAAEELVPAPREQALLDRIKETALRAHLLLDCNGVTRTDMIYADDTLWVLEINTLPGLTATSLIPRAFQAQGGTFGELIDRIIASAHCSR